jgi:hypothetical protein
LNALGVLTEDTASGTVVWEDVFSRIKQDSPADQLTSSYFNAYVLDAMAPLAIRQRPSTRFAPTGEGCVLGITPAAPGYDIVDVHPDLSGLQYAEGSVLMPHGLIKLRLDQMTGLALELPTGITQGNVLYKPADRGQATAVDGKPPPHKKCAKANQFKSDAVVSITITTPGHHRIGPN